MNKIIKVQELNINLFDPKVDNILLKKNFPKIFNKYKKQKKNERNIVDIFDNHFNSKYNSEYEILWRKVHKLEKEKETAGNWIHEKKIDKNGAEFISSSEFIVKDKVKFKLIEKKISKIYKMQHNLWRKFHSGGKLKFANEYADKIYKKKNWIYIYLSDGTKQIISNHSVIKYNNFECENIDISYTDRFVIVVINKVNLQASSIGIWDIQLNNWCFSEHIETEVLTSSNRLNGRIYYDAKKDVFTFKSHHFSGITKSIQDCEFEITKKRKIRWLKDSEFTDDYTWYGEKKNK